MAEPSIPLMAPAGVLGQPIAFIARAGWLVPLVEEQDALWLWLKPSQLGTSLALFFGLGVKSGIKLNADGASPGCG